MASSESNIPSSMLMSSICAPSSTCRRETASASSYFPVLIRRRNLAEPVMLARSPIFMKLESGRISISSRPLRIVFEFPSGRCLGFRPPTASTMAFVCSGVDPQQLPTILAYPLSTNSLRFADMCSDVSSYSPNSFGSPALGWTDTKCDDTLANPARNVRISSLPSEQLIPTLNSGAWVAEA